MEYWDLYNENREKLNKVVQRGNNLEDNEFHLVVNVWIKNSNGEFLITQRAENKTYAYMWECTGGSALEGEDSIEAALREAKEELGVDLNKEDGKLVGSILRYYPKCNDMLDVWVFNSDISIDDVSCQEEEVAGVMWASPEKIMQLKNENMFEANAYFDEIINNNIDII